MVSLSLCLSLGLSVSLCLSLSLCIFICLCLSAFLSVFQSAKIPAQFTVQAMGQRHTKRLESSATRKPWLQGGDPRVALHDRQPRLSVAASSLANIAKGASRAVSFLHRARSVLSRPQLSTIYKSHVRSRMEYCSPIWSGASTSSLARLDRVQARAAKLIGSEQAFLLPSLAHRRSVAALAAMHRIVHRSAPVPLLSFCPALAPTHRHTN